MRITALFLMLTLSGCSFAFSTDRYQRERDGGSTGGCPTLVEPSNGSLDRTNGDPGDVAVYTCSGGYRLVGNGGADRRVCQSDGMWTGSDPTCDVIVSPCEPNPCYNGGTCTDDGTSFTCACAAGFGGATCVMPTACLEALSAPVNGSVDAPDNVIGATATYSCSAGFFLVGSATRTCQTNGQWSGSTPTCEVGSSCADTRVRFSATTDGSYVIDPDGPGGPLRPFSVYCHEMATTSPTDWLELAHTSGPTETVSNYSTYALRSSYITDCGCPASAPSIAIRRWQRMRLDVTTLHLVQNSQFSTLNHNEACIMASGGCQSPGNFLIAGSCVASFDTSGRANLDLRDTPFHVTAETFSTFAIQPNGFNSSGSVLSMSADNKVIDISGGGECGGFGVYGSPNAIVALEQDP